jgi:hypothetical protein
MQYSLFEKDGFYCRVIVALILVKCSRTAPTSAHLHNSGVDWPVSVNGDKHTSEVSQFNNMDNVERGADQGRYGHLNSQPLELELARLINIS